MNGYRPRPLLSAVHWYLFLLLLRGEFAPDASGQLLAAANPPALGRSSGSGSVQQHQKMGSSWTLLGQVTLPEKAGSFFTENHPPPSGTLPLSIATALVQPFLFVNPTLEAKLKVHILRGQNSVCKGLCILPA